MIIFAAPHYLLLLLLIPFFFLGMGLWLWGRRRRLRRFGDEALVNELMPSWSRGKLWVRTVLLSLAFFFFVIGLSRPQIGAKLKEHKIKGAEIMIVLDVSNSMLAQDYSPDRLERAKLAISRITDKLKDDRIGLIVFAGTSFVQLPIPSDYVSAKMFLETISPAMVSVQGTDIAAAIDLATRSFTNQEGVSRAIFVITDGEDNEGGAVEAAKEAAKKGMRVYMLGIGDPNGAPIPQQGSSNYILDEEGNVVVSKLNEDMCREIAKAGNGSYIYVDNSSSAQVKLNEQINRLAKTRMESQMYNDYDEQFQGFVLLGLMFLLLDIMLQERENQRFNFSKIFSRRMKS